MAHDQKVIEMETARRLGIRAPATAVDVEAAALEKSANFFGTIANGFGGVATWMQKSAAEAEEAKEKYQGAVDYAAECKAAETKAYDDMATEKTTWAAVRASYDNKITELEGALRASDQMTQAAHRATETERKAREQADVRITKMLATTKKVPRSEPVVQPAPEPGNWEFRVTGRDVSNNITKVQAVKMKSN